MREKGVLRMDTIQIKGLRIFAYHGVGPEEKRAVSYTHLRAHET